MHEETRPRRGPWPDARHNHFTQRFKHKRRRSWQRSWRASTEPSTHDFQQRSRLDWCASDSVMEYRAQEVPYII
uniref:Uncharacterized protein n=1 Tax=Knipowitschia caucasica TaxID=637954 RepID=A0AAV2MDU8_KNICA